MSLLSVVPDVVAAASGNLENVGSTLRSANAAAANQTTAIAAPAGDEVSAAITSVFGTHAQEFQALNAKAAAFHDEFVNLLSGGATRYVSTEVANAQQTLVNAVNSPAEALLGHPLIGTAAAAADVSPINQSFSFPYGPLTISGNQTVTPTSDGFSGVTNAAVTLNGLRGPVTLLSGSGSESFSNTTGVLSANFAGNGPGLALSGSGTFAETTGAFSANFAGKELIFPVGGSVTGTFPPSGTGSPQITGLSLEFAGIPLPTQAVTAYLNAALQAFAAAP